MTLAQCFMPLFIHSIITRHSALCHNDVHQELPISPEAENSMIAATTLTTT